MYKYIFSLFLLFSFSITFAAIYNVPGTYTSIQSGINAASDGDTVLVEPGTYFENINFRGKNIVVTSRFYINNDLSYITSTIINGSTPVHPDTASCVIISSGEDSSAVLQGFTITGGTGTKWQDIHGAGRYTEGGGILIELASPVIRFNIIRNNSAINTTGLSGAGGGGIRIGDGNPKILNNVITYNTGLYGAGIVLNYTGFLIQNNIITNNFGSNSFNSGAAIWCIDGLANTSKRIINNTIYNNSSVNGCGGIYAAAGGSLIPLEIRNNIIWGNRSNVNQNQMLLTGLTTYIHYNSIQNGWTSGTGNINIQPSFSDTNYILSVTSGVIDKGDTSAIYNDPGVNNIASYPSRGTTRNDPGAYGGPLSRILSSSLIGINSNTKIIRGFTLKQNFPNPFNPSTVISFELAERRDVKLVVYNVLGTNIRTLLDKKLDAGEHKVTWNASHLPAGVYFYTLFLDGTRTDTKKMLLIK